MPTLFPEGLSKPAMRYVCLCLSVLGTLALTPTAPARSGASPPRLEGEPDGPACTRAVPVTGFVQREPADGAAPTHRTEARVLYDDSAIYVAVKAFDDTPDQIKAFLTRRDVN